MTEEKLSSPFGDYVILEKIGKGAFASVFKARRVDTGQLFALKKFETKGMPRNTLTSITNEMNLLKRLNHPNIVKIIGNHQQNDDLYLILEYAENGSLLKLVKNIGGLPEHTIAVYIEQVLSALAYLHKEDVIHRDIKAANVLLNKEGKALLSDFGVATVLEDGGKHFTIVGSPYWMAPEVISESGHNTLSDIWSLGCMIVELLTGEPPFFKVNPMQAMFKIVQSPMPIPPCSAELHDLLSLCFRKPASERPSAEILLQHPWLQQAKIGTAPQPPVSPNHEDNAAFHSLPTSATVPDTTEDGHSKRSHRSRRSHHSISKTKSMNDGYPIDYQQVTSKGSSESSTSMSPNVGARDTQSDMEILSPRPALPPTPGSVPHEEDVKKQLLAMSLDPDSAQKALKPLFVNSLVPTVVRTVPPLEVCSMLAVGCCVWVGGSQGILSIWKADELKSLTQLQLHKTKVTALIQVKNHVWAGSEENLIYTLKFRKTSPHDTEHKVISHLLHISAGHKRIWSCGVSATDSQIAIISKRGSVKSKFVIPHLVISMEQLADGMYKHNADNGRGQKTEGKKANALLLVGDYLWIAEGNQVRVINLEYKEVKVMPHPSEVEQLCTAQNLVISGDTQGNIHGSNIGPGRKTMAVVSWKSLASVWVGSQDRSICIWQPPGERT